MAQMTCYLCGRDVRLIRHILSIRWKNVPLIIVSPLVGESRSVGVLLRCVMQMKQASRFKTDGVISPHVLRGQRSEQLWNWELEDAVELRASGVEMRL